MNHYDFAKAMFRMMLDLTKSQRYYIILLGGMYRPIQHLKTMLSYSESLLDEMNTSKAGLSKGSSTTTYKETGLSTLIRWWVGIHVVLWLSPHLKHMCLWLGLERWSRARFHDPLTTLLSTKSSTPHYSCDQLYK